MPIGGGTFTLQNKVLPGVYMNFVSASGGVSAGSRGIASIPAELGWGAEDTIIKMDSGDFNRQAVTVFGYDATAPELLLIREAFKRAKTLLVYRVDGGGSKATKEIGGITVTARYSGTRGNALKVAVLENTDESFDVVTYLDTTEMDRQTATEAAGLTANDFVVFGGEGPLSAAVATALEGGTNGTANGAAYTRYLSAVEVEQFNTLCYPGTDSETKGLFVAFVDRKSVV